MCKPAAGVTEYPSLIVSGATDIIMVRQRIIIKEQGLFVEPFFKNIFDHSIIYSCTVCCSCACCFKTLFGIFFFKHQHTEAGLVILLPVDTVIQHMLCSMPGIWTYCVGF